MKRKIHIIKMLFNSKKENNKQNLCKNFPKYYWHLLGYLHVVTLAGTFLKLKEIKCPLNYVLYCTYSSSSVALKKRAFSLENEKYWPKYLWTNTDNTHKLRNINHFLRQEIGKATFCLNLEFTKTRAYPWGRSLNLILRQGLMVYVLLYSAIAATITSCQASYM